MSFGKRNARQHRAMKARQEREEQARDYSQARKVLEALADAADPLLAYQERTKKIFSEKAWGIRGTADVQPASILEMVELSAAYLDARNLLDGNVGGLRDAVRS